MTSKVIEKTQCPKCAANGGDNSGDNLAVYDDGHKYCFACKYTEGTEGSKRKRGVQYPPYALSLDSLPGKPMIPSTVLETFGVRGLPYLDDKGKVLGKASWSGEVIYPYYDLKGTLQRIKYRDFRREEEDLKKKRKAKKHTWFSEGGEITVFGLQLCDPDKSSTLIITEGESDCMCVKTQFPKADVVGLSGASTVAKVIKTLATWIRRYSYIYVCLDTDEEGTNATFELMELLPAPRTWYVELPDDVKDPCEAVLAGYSLKEYFDSARQVEDPDLLTGDQLKQQFIQILTPDRYHGFDVGISCVNKMLGGGLRPGEVLGIVGHSGSGKTSFTQTLAYNMLNQTKVFWVGTEMQPGNMLQKFVETDLKQQIRINKETGEPNVPMDEINDSLDFLSQRLVFYKTLAYEFDDAEQAMLAAIYNDCGVIIIDVLGDIDEKMNDYKTSKSVMHRLNDLAQGDPEDNRPPCAIICVAHTVKVDGKYERIISKSSVEGGKNIVTNFTACIALNGNADDEGPDRHLNVLKRSRMGNTEVMDGKVKWKPEACCYVGMRTGDYV